MKHSILHPDVFRTTKTADQSRNGQPKAVEVLIIGQPELPTETSIASASPVSTANYWSISSAALDEVETAH